jgi:hypothetical protein
MNNCEKYEMEFNQKIEHFKGHLKYAWLRKYADEAVTWHTGFGFLAIRGQDFMDRIIQKPLEYIEEWLNGKNKLEW